MDYFYGAEGRNKDKKTRLHFCNLFTLEDFVKPATHETV